MRVRWVVGCFFLRSAEKENLWPKNEKSSISVLCVVFVLTYGR
jgi:hypothetical protein